MPGYRICSRAKAKTAILKSWKLWPRISRLPRYAAWVKEIPAAECRRLLEKLIIPQRILTSDVPRGSRSEATGEKTGGKTYTLMDGSEAFLWTFQESYLGVGNAGAVHLWFFIEKFATSRRIYSSNIQTENGVVQALGHDFLFE